MKHTNRKRQILLVESNHTLNVALVRMLGLNERINADISPVNEYNLALRYLLSNPRRYDLMIAGAGRENEFLGFLQSALQISPNMRVVIFTDRRRKKTPGHVDAVVFKPDVVALERTIVEVVAGHA